MPGLGTALTKAALQDMEEQGVKVRIVHDAIHHICHFCSTDKIFGFFLSVFDCVSKQELDQ